MIKFKTDYLKTGKRQSLHTTIREDLYNELGMLSFKTRQPISKIIDVMIIDIFENEESTKKFLNLLKKY